MQDQSEKLTKRFVAGVILYDLVGYSWSRLDLAAGQENYLHVSGRFCTDMSVLFAIVNRAAIAQQGGL